ncbi:MAG: mandelate racemase/muconate lactonizing enzyme family protein [Lachnospiraceae bacterium]
MKITDIKTICLKYPYQEFIADGQSACFGRGALLIQVETDTEITGLGECATFGASMSAMADIIEHQLKPLMIGQNPLDIERLWETMVWSNFANGRRGLVMGAISGIDIALWDIAGKAAGLPLYRLLGANSDKVRGYASAGFYAPNKGIDELKREMEGYMEKGYTAFKMKVGRCRNQIGMPHRYVRKGDFTISFAEDMERVAAVRETIGKDSILMLDMNCTWDVDTVLSAEKYFDKYDIYWIEEPSRSDDVAGYAKIAAGLKRTRVAGCESEQGLARYKELLEQKALDVVQANLGWSGGFTECRRIAALSLAYDKLFTPHTFFSAVLTAANVHFAASLPNVPFIESEENYNPLRTELLKEPLQCDGEMNYLVPQKPGLGVELNMDVVEKYRA